VTDEEVRRLHGSALLVDLHNDVALAVARGADIGRRGGARHTDLERLREGGVGAVFFAAYVAPDFIKRNQAAHRALEIIDVIRHDIIGRYPRDFELALTAADIERIRGGGKIAALIAIEGGHAVEDSLRLLRSFYALGVRYLTLTHTNTNNWADSSMDKPRHGGLAPLGREIVAEMNRLGMLVDVSHVSDDAFWQVLETSRAPVIASHSSCRALSPIARNLSDEMIRALARRGGVIHINFGCEFVSAEAAAASPFFTPSVKERKPVPRAGLEHVVAHIDHVVRLAGVDAVGIGSDFDGIECTPAGLDDVSRFPNLTRALVERRYTAEEIRKIYGGNLLRVMREAERVAGQVDTRR
jgi:membrane dipeptidase